MDKTEQNNREQDKPQAVDVITASLPPLQAWEAAEATN